MKNLVFSVRVRCRIPGIESYTFQAFNYIILRPIVDKTSWVVSPKPINSSPRRVSFQSDPCTLVINVTFPGVEIDMCRRGSVDSDRHVWGDFPFGEGSFTGRLFSFTSVDGKGDVREVVGG